MLKAHAAATVRLLQQAGLARADAHKAVAKVLSQLGVRPERGSGTITAITVRNWCDEVARADRHDTVAMMHQHKLDRGQTMLSGLSQDEARQSALEVLTHWVGTLFPKLRKPT
jgi:hypothetical protein